LDFGNRGILRIMSLAEQGLSWRIRPPSAGEAPPDFLRSRDSTRLRGVIA